MTPIDIFLILLVFAGIALVATRSPESHLLSTLSDQSTDKERIAEMTEQMTKTRRGVDGIEEGWTDEHERISAETTAKAATFKARIFIDGDKLNPFYTNEYSIKDGAVFFTAMGRKDIFSVRIRSKESETGNIYKHYSKFREMDKPMVATNFVVTEI
jgi:hypothetical protein